MCIRDSLWGVVLAGIAMVLILVRYVQARTEQAFVEAAALCTLAFFLLSTRMHERYMFDGLLFTIAAAPIARRYAWAAAIFSLTLFVNLLYSLNYLAVVMQSTPGVNPVSYTHLQRYRQRETEKEAHYDAAGASSVSAVAARSFTSMPARSAKRNRI